MLNKFDCYKKQIKKNMLIYYIYGKKRLIMKYYEQMLGYTYDFDNPKTFTEKLNTRKASNNKLLKKCADKVMVREYVKEKIGAEYLIPEYFVTNRLTKKLYKKMPNQCVLKTASGSGTVEIIFDKSKINMKETLKLMREYQKVKFHYIWGEMFYKGIKNKIICEKLLLTKDGKVPIDIKVHCFRNGGGKPKYFIQLDIDRFGDHRRNYYDENFKLLDIQELHPNYDKKVEKPKNWNEILTVAKKLSEDFDYVRVDLYSFEDKVYFGELTFSHNAGFSVFNPPKWNKLFGKYWKS